ncbi:MAG: DnaJ domain-containing protein [Deltaproteobacteria bacterium]|nr:DnaJ domain-containing protein [Deltaproteobacteria bacterium]MBW2068310.1 DnaJ domain-containing protein [Deltaproteobacteria bacterium]
MPELSECYKLLGLKPGATVEEIKRAYRRLAKEWHPDRLGPEASESSREEARLKFAKITDAYKTVLNHARVMEQIKKHGSSFYSAESPAGTESKVSSSEKVQRKASRDVKQPGAFFNTRAKVMALLFSILLLSSFIVRDVMKRSGPRYVFKHSSPPVHVRTESIMPQTGHKIPGKNLPSVNEFMRRRGFFSLGSTKQQVMAVQGPPDRVYGRAWYYGLSMLFFEGDRVVGYDNFDGRLRIRLVPRKLPQTIPSWFTLGSSKDEVLLVQGTPTRVFRSVWYYGLDKVFFKNGRVVGYDNFTGRLNVRLVPSSSVFTSDKRLFTIGSTPDEVIAVQGTPTRVQRNRWYYGLSEVIFRKGHVAWVNNIGKNLKFMSPSGQEIGKR